jgi:hypothetical protein
MKTEISLRCHIAVDMGSEGSCLYGTRFLIGTMIPPHKLAKLPLAYMQSVLERVWKICPYEGKVICPYQDSIEYGPRSR